jgi:uncharacterized membrane protein YdjX (TVP38/TMEM64 family)
MVSIPSFSFLNRVAANLRRPPVLALVAVFSLVGTVYGSVLFGNALKPLLSSLWDPEINWLLLQKWQNVFGVWLPAIFVLMQTLQVVIAPIPGEMTGLLAGYLFGAHTGFVYSMVGLTLGSCLDFCLGRWLGKYLLHKIIPKEILENFGFLRKKEGRLIAFLLFLTPGFPKDYLSYFLGMTPMTFGAFFLVTTAGRAPATWMLSLQGAQVARGNYILFLWLIGAAAVVTVGFYAYRKKVYGWMRRNSRMENSIIP